jgi:hypothetical protein
MAAGQIQSIHFYGGTSISQAGKILYASNSLVMLFIQRFNFHCISTSHQRGFTKFHPLQISRISKLLKYSSLEHFDKTSISTTSQVTHNSIRDNSLVLKYFSLTHFHHVSLPASQQRQNPVHGNSLVFFLLSVTAQLPRLYRSSR